MKKEIKKKNKENNRNIAIIIVIIMVLALISGGTYSWFMWRSNNNTSVTVQVPGRDNVLLTITGNNASNTGMIPISNSNCETSAHTLKGEATITVKNTTLTDMEVTPRLDIIIPSSIASAKANLHWAVVDISDDVSNVKTCVTTEYKGTFDKSAVVTVTNPNENSDVSVTGGTSFTAVGTNSTINITGSAATNVLKFTASKRGNSENVKYTTRKYRLYVWLDGGYQGVPNIGTEVKDPMQNATITVKWSNYSSMTQIGT